MPPTRRHLIPGRFKVRIEHPRINRIYHELQKLQVGKFPNCCGVMLRVLLELSVNEFASRHGVSLKKKVPPNKNATGEPTGQPGTKTMTLGEKLRTAASYLRKNGICSQADLDGIRTLAARKNYVASLHSLNAYVHNKGYNPSVDDLLMTWDNIQAFMKAIWTA